MKKGRVYDVVSLFSTPQRDFLIRNNGEKVKVDSLKGKTVAIYFISLIRVSADRTSRVIKEVYDDLSPQNNFQVVLVADVFDDGNDRKDKKLFKKFFSTMPFLAIPQDDKESRRKLLSELGSKCLPKCPLLDGNGKILDPDAIDKFNLYGAESYPFTPERMTEIHTDDMSAKFSMSLKRLLTTPTRDFLITYNYEEVPVSDLEGKVVAFYFYPGREGIVDYLIDLYDSLRLMRKQFEIVFINSRRTKDERSFMEAFESTPWLGLPSNDMSYLKLMRIFGCTAGDLVIVSPGEKFPDTYGLDVIRRYEIEAYPFTRRRVTEMEIERLKSLTLESILFSGDCKYIEGNGGQKITANHLVNKTILLLFTLRGCVYCHRLVLKLITWYNETKKRVKEDVEIIHIPYGYDPAKEPCFGTMPWLQFPYDKNYIVNLLHKRLNAYHVPMIVVFGADGKIVNMNFESKFIYEECESEIEYPLTFTDVELFSEVESNVAYNMFWPVEEDEYAKMFSPISRHEYEDAQRREYEDNQRRKKEEMKKLTMPVEGVKCSSIRVERMKMRTKPVEEAGKRPIREDMMKLPWMLPVEGMNMEGKRRR